MNWSKLFIVLFISISFFKHVFHLFDAIRHREFAMTTVKTSTDLNNKPRSLVKSDTNALIFHSHVSIKMSELPSPSTIDRYTVIEFIFKSCSPTSFYHFWTFLHARFIPVSICVCIDCMHYINRPHNNYTLYF